MNTQIPRAEYPRPQMVREDWINLNGKWQFEIDFGAEGYEREFFKRESLNGEIIVPFCPESELSKVNYKGFMNCVWYKRNFTVPETWSGKSVILHFGAVDYKATVWINGEKAGEHLGGYTSFCFDITKYLKKGENSVTVAAFDDDKGTNQPRGKQSGKYGSHGCYYTRTTGIWQTVWLEAVEKEHITLIKSTPDAYNGKVTFEVKTSADTIGCKLEAQIYYEGKHMGSAAAQVGSYSTFMTAELSEKHLWEVGKGRLYDVELKLTKKGEIKDSVQSYFGLRSVGMKDGAFILNGRAVFGRWVLDQGFYPDGIYTAPSDEALKRDIELSFELGFNGARLHEKVFEPRYLYWADKLGYLVWGEHANWGLGHWNAESLMHFLPEWLEAMERDYSHPSIIGWCPFNETWDDEASGKRQIDLVIETVYRATKACDASRPVIDTSGNFHTVTDIFDVHDYEQNPDKFKEDYDGFYEFGDVKDQIYRGFPDRQKWNGEPVFVSEYGGIKWPLDETAGWGYGDAPKNREEFFDRYRRITECIMKNEHIMGLCYTQLYDVEQEKNGLLTYEREFKFEPDIIREINMQEAAIEKKYNK